MQLDVTAVRKRSSGRESVKALVGAALDGVVSPVRYGPEGTLIPAFCGTAADAALFGVNLLPADAGGETDVAQDALLELTLGSGQTLHQGKLVVVGRVPGSLWLYEDLYPGDIVQIVGLATEDNVLSVKPYPRGAFMSNPSPPLAVTLSAHIDDANWGTSEIIEIDGGAASRNVTGMVAAPDGYQRRIVNVGATNNVVLKNEDASSAAANRIHGGADITLTPGTFADVFYRIGTLNRWRAPTQVP